MNPWLKRIEPNSSALAGSVALLMSFCSIGCAQIAGIEDWTPGTSPCEPGTHRCTGAQLAVCSETGTTWDTIQTCDPATVCDAATGSCFPRFCDEGVYRCKAEALERCAHDRVSWTRVGTCNSPELCDAPGGQCDICVGGTWSCDGASLTRCQDDGQLIAVEEICNSPLACNARNGTCGASSCVGETGADTKCGLSGQKNCCGRAVVEAGTFNRSNDPSFPATVSKFQLDEFEVTVGRFRTFVDNGLGIKASAPVAGAGEHPKIYGSGWNSSWDERLVEKSQVLRAALRCDGGFETWTDDPGSHERRPIVCVTWFEAFAFCVWDGGRLPTEAEWNLAAAGGGEQRNFPWGNDIDATRASYDCLGDGSPPDLCAIGDILEVGSKSPSGDGRWSHADLAGNVSEWTLDRYSNYLMPCNDCAQLMQLDYKFACVIRGGAFDSTGDKVKTSVRVLNSPGTRSARVGFRCAK